MAHINLQPDRQLSTLDCRVHSSSTTLAPSPGALVTTTITAAFMTIDYLVAFCEQRLRRRGDAHIILVRRGINIDRTTRRLFRLREGVGLAARLSLAKDVPEP